MVDVFVSVGAGVAAVVMLLLVVSTIVTAFGDRR
jgi:hypothetical protein